MFCGRAAERGSIKTKALVFTFVTTCVFAMVATWPAIPIAVLCCIAAAPAAGLAIEAMEIVLNRFGIDISSRKSNAEQNVGGPKDESTSSADLEGGGR